MNELQKSYLDMHVQLIAMIENGLGESAEADELRDRMDIPWYKMKQDEIAEVVEALAIEAQVSK